MIIFQNDGFMSCFCWSSMNTYLIHILSYGHWAVSTGSGFEDENGGKEIQSSVIVVFIIIIIIIKFFTVGIVHSYKKTNSNQLFTILKIEEIPNIKEKERSVCNSVIRSF